MPHAKYRSPTTRGQTTVSQREKKLSVDPAILGLPPSRLLKASDTWEMSHGGRVPPGFTNVSSKDPMLMKQLIRLFYLLHSCVIRVNG